MRLKIISKTGIFNLGYQLLFIVLMFLLGYESRLEISQGPRFLILSAMVLVSGLIWIWFFYLQDRREPEPIPYIMTAFLAGMAAWSLIGHPVIHIIFQTGDWINASPLLFIQGVFLIKGMMFSLLIFGLIRFGLMPLKEFDEPVDGMVYGAVCGAGYAVALIIRELWIHPDYTLFTMAYITTTGIMVYSAIGSLMGYYIGKAKFDKQTFQLNSMFGVTLGILLLGFYYLVNELLFIAGLGHAFWISFFFTMVYSLWILVCCVLKMKHLTSRKPKRARRKQFRFKPLMAVYTMGLFIAGSVVAINGSAGAEYNNARYGIRFNYPHSLSAPVFRKAPQGLFMTASQTEILFSRKRSRHPAFQLTLEVRREGGKLENSRLITYLPPSKTENLRIQDVNIGGKKGKRLTSSRLEKSDLKPMQFPVLMKTVTDIIPVHNHHLVFTFSAPSSGFEAALKEYGKILSTLEWTVRR